MAQSARAAQYIQDPANAAVDGPGGLQEQS